MSQNRVVWLGPDDASDAFPNVENAMREPNGLLAAGGDLSSERLLAAYAQGIFPWYEDAQPILWWSPDPRCVLFPDKLHVSRRLRQELRRSSLAVAFNRDFGATIQACAGERRSNQGTWITTEMAHAYGRLHAEGWAHSVEVYDDDKLVGGLYGLCIGRVFFGESMFSAKANASKYAMLGLTRHMLEHKMELLDCQVVSAHLFSMGAQTIPRREFSRLLDAACTPPAPHTAWPQEPIPAAELLPF